MAPLLLLLGYGQLPPVADQGATMHHAAFPEHSNRIAIFRALHLGDLLCSVPAMRALRRSAPHAHVALIGLPWATEFVARFSAYLDELIVFPGYPGMPERPFAAAELPPFLQAMHRRRFDLAIQMQGNGFLSNGFVAQLGARRTAGFYLPGTWRPDETYVAYPTTVPEPERHLALVRHLGVDTDADGLEFPITDDDRAELEAVAPPHALGSYVVVHAGARDPLRRWPPERFAAVGDRLAREGLAVIVTGTEGEAPATAGVVDALTAPAMDLTSRLSIGALGALLESATLLVTNDTGVSHLAAAIRTPSVVVFSASDPARWAPADRGLHRVLGGPVERATPGHCCLGEICPHRAEEWQQVRTDEVMREALDLLTGRFARAS